MRFNQMLAEAVNNCFYEIITVHWNMKDMDSVFKKFKMQNIKNEIYYKT